jgi:hypothetical protein
MFKTIKVKKNSYKFDIERAFGERSLLVRLNILKQNYLCAFKMSISNLQITSFFSARDYVSKKIC